MCTSWKHMGLSGSQVQHIKLSHLLCCVHHLAFVQSVVGQFSCLFLPDYFTPQPVVFKPATDLMVWQLDRVAVAAQHQSTVLLTLPAPFVKLMWLAGTFGCTLLSFGIVLGLSRHALKLPLVLFPAWSGRDGFFVSVQ